MRILPWWPKMPWYLRVIRRLVREKLDAEEHNEYLVRTNGNLTEKNTKLNMEVETLRWRVGDVEHPPPLMADAEGD